MSVLASTRVKSVSVAKGAVLKEEMKIALGVMSGLAMMP